MCCAISQETLPHILYGFPFLPLLSSPLLSSSIISTHAAIRVDNTLSPVTTRTGCQVLLTCAGLGTSIQWTMFGGVAPLEDNENLSTHIQVSKIVAPHTFIMDTQEK